MAQYQWSSSNVCPMSPAKSAPTPTVTGTDQSARNTAGCNGRKTFVQLRVRSNPSTAVNSKENNTDALATTSTWATLIHSAGIVATAPAANTAKVAPPGCHLCPLTAPGTNVANSSN